MSWVVSWDKFKPDLMGKWIDEWITADKWTNRWINELMNIYENMHILNSTIDTW